MLHPVAELTEDRLGDVEGALRYEVNADSLGADQADYLLNLLLEEWGRVVEEQVRFIEEKSDLGLLQVTRLGEALEEFRHEPE